MPEPDKSSKQAEIHHRTLKDFVVNILYIAVLCIVVHGMRSHYRLHMYKSLRSVFVDKIFDDKQINFLKVSSFHDVWEYLENVTLPVLFYETYPNGAPVGEEEVRSILLENRLLGFPRLRQMRVRNDSCIALHILEKENASCFGSYSESTADREPFGPGNSSAWNFHDEDEIGSSLTIGKISSYGGSGYFQDLGPTLQKAKSQLNYLKRSKWITQASRVLLLQFAMFNGEMNFFAIVGLTMEFPPTGGVFTSYQINTIPLVLYNSTYQQFLLVCQCFFIIYTVYYIWEELLEFRKLKWDYMKNTWNIFDVSILALSAAVISVYVAREIAMYSLIRSFSGNLRKFVNFGTVAFWQLLYDQISALLVFLAWLKVFKYISFNKTMAQLATTLAMSAIEITGFAIMFFIVFIWYACVGYLLFGTQVSQYKSIYDAVMTLTQANLGEFHYRDISKANHTSGSLFIASYVFFVFFVLLNMFLAIITETYSIVKKDIAKENLSQIVNVFVTPLRKLQSKLFSILDINKKSKSAFMGIVEAAVQEKSIFEKIAYGDPEENCDPVTVEEYKRLQHQVNDLAALIARLDKQLLPQIAKINKDWMN